MAVVVVEAVNRTASRARCLMDALVARVRDAVVASDAA